MKRISENGLNLIKEFEGLELEPYLCPANIPSIGYGNTYYEDGTKVTLQDEAITESRANELLENIANKDFASVIIKSLEVPLSQNQFDALVSFVYNVGNRNFRRSTLRKKLNRGDYEGASREFNKWIYSGGKVLKGLKERRKLEAELFKGSF